MPETASEVGRGAIMTRPIIFVLASAFTLMANLGVARSAPSGQAIEREAGIVGQFHDRVRAYLAVNADTFSEGEPEDVVSEELCSLLDVSPHVDSVPPRRGTIFTAALDDLFRRIVPRVLSPIDQADVLRVMPLFPGGVPVQFVSPSLFRALPRLPKRLEYRFQQHDLVILDLHTGVIVDSVWMVIGPSAT
jgi:hypothetical protein